MVYSLAARGIHRAATDEVERVALGQFDAGTATRQSAGIGACAGDGLAALIGVAIVYNLSYINYNVDRYSEKRTALVSCLLSFRFSGVHAARTVQAECNGTCSNC